jgi:hypothetical protein
MAGQDAAELCIRAVRTLHADAAGAAASCAAQSMGWFMGQPLQ